MVKEEDFQVILFVVGSIGYPLHICSSFHVHVFFGDVWTSSTKL